MRHLHLPSVLLVLLALATPAVAETRYVTDQVYVNLRAAPSNAAESLVILQTGAAMEVLGREGEFLKVRLPNGSEGYFPERYASKDLPKALVIGERDKKIRQLEETVATLKGERGDSTVRLEETLQQTQGRLKQLEQEKAALARQLDETTRAQAAARQQYESLAAGAQNVVALAGERDELLQTNGELRQELERLKHENESLLISGVIKWFLIGAAVLFVGWLMGRSGRRRRSGLV